MSVAIFYKRKYAMHLFGFMAFVFIAILGCISFFKHLETVDENLTVYLLYGVFIFFFNLFYLKAIRLSREDYENKLKKEKEYSERLLKSQKRFLRYTVHETNTPLAVIMANIELYELEQGRNATLQNIEAATKNIASMYDDLSYLIQKEKLEYPKRMIEFGTFIQSRIDFFDIVAKQSDVGFKIVDKTDNATIYFNETRLQRIIDNNITNAIKYTYVGEVITLLLKCIKNKVIFEISSHSTHIEDTEHIFDAYYREDYEEDGLGLGLDLVQNICQKENVKIIVTSTDKCTTFSYAFIKDKK